MPNNIPHFKYRKINGYGKNLICIEVDGKVIHEVQNLYDFYKTFGFTEELGKSGILPEEFIWTEYVKDNEANYFACTQMHIIDYLKRFSELFRETYGAQCDSWIAAYAKSTATRDKKCVSCKMNPHCSNLAPEY